MNDPNPDPIDVDPLDERLSAALDGEPDAEPDGVAPAAGTEPRRRALQDARDLLAIAPPPLDDLTRRRLIRAAAAQHPLAAPARRRPWMRRLAAAAVLVPLLLVAGIGIAHLGGGNGGKASNGALSSTPARGAARSGLPTDLHEVADARFLRARVLGALRAAGVVAPSLSESSGTAPVGSAAPGSPADRCLAAVHPPKGTTARALADATFHGAAATVYVALQGQQALVYVLANADCHLLTAQFIATR